MPSTDKAKIKERKRKYWLANRERLLAYHKDYIKKNPQVSRRKQKKYWANNPEKAQAFNRKRRARANNVEHIPYTKEEVLKKYGTDCHICGAPIDLKAPRKAGKKGWEHGLHLDQGSSRGLKCLTLHIAILLWAFRSPIPLRLLFPMACISVRTTTMRILTLLS